MQRMLTKWCTHTHDARKTIKCIFIIGKAEWCTRNNSTLPHQAISRASHTAHTAQTRYWISSSFEIDLKAERCWVWESWCGKRSNREIFYYSTEFNELLFHFASSLAASPCRPLSPTLFCPFSNIIQLASIHFNSRGCESVCVAVRVCLSVFECVCAHKPSGHAPNAAHIHEHYLMVLNGKWLQFRLPEMTTQHKI